MDMRELIPVKVQEHENGAKTVEVALDDGRSFWFASNVYAFVEDDGVHGNDLFLRHLERLFHTDPSSSGIIYPPLDIADMRDLFENQSVDIDTTIVSPDDVSGDLLRLLPEIRCLHSIENRAAFVLLEGDIGLLEADDAAHALGENCNTEVGPVAFYTYDIPGKVYASLWWFFDRE